MPRTGGNNNLDEKDREILNQIQSAFPISSSPYRELGKKVGLSEDELFQRVGKLKERGIIRRIGGNFHSGKLNFSSTLCAARVPKEKVKSFVREVNNFPGVTHNYLRNNEYNIWFTFIAKDMETIEKALKEIALRTGVEDILSLPAIKTYKIKVDFEV
jgi:DNA-binding Lrp family transcriptional regulator